MLTCVCVCVSWQVEGGMLHLADDCVSGKWSELPATLSLVLQQYSSQFHLQLEVQGLRSR